MMTLLAGALQWLVGAPKLLTAGALLTITLLAHQWWLERDAHLKAQGAQQCQAEYQLAGVRAQRDAALAQIARAREETLSQQTLAETLRHDRQAIADEFAAYKAAASTDPNCLSPGVLDLLRGGNGLGKGR